MNSDITFAGFQRITDLSLLEADIAILGLPEATSYTGKPSHSADAPKAIRQATREYADELDHYDFDLNGPLLPEPAPRVVDCGDIAGDPQNGGANRERITRAVQAIVDRGCVPIIIGGDDSVPIPCFAAYSAHEPLTVVQIDAHIDWRHEVNGVTQGYSSTMRRASELPWIEKLVQVGMRGVGSARAGEVDAARSYGARLIRARDVARGGVGPVIDAVPAGGTCVVNIDCDGLDPAVIPAVMAPTPGGLSYQQMIDILHGIAAKARLVAVHLVEFAPRMDVNGLGAVAAARIVCNAIGAIARHLQGNDRV